MSETKIMGHTLITVENGHIHGVSLGTTPGATQEHHDFEVGRYTALLRERGLSYTTTFKQED